MPIIKFDYIPYPYLQAKNKLVAVYRPVIQITISANHKVYPNTISCLVDSGADFNLFPATIGESLGLKIKTGEKVTHMGIANVGIAAYKHPVKIYIKEYSFKTDIDFSYDHKIPILGRHGFFDHFQSIKSNEKLLRLELTY